MMGVFHLVAALSLASNPIDYEVSETRGIRTAAEKDGALVVTKGSQEQPHSYSWVTVRDFPDEWMTDFSRFSTVTATIENRSSRRVETMFWVCGSEGWSAVGDFANLKPGESKKFSANLWEKFPDGRLKIDPRSIDKIQVMVRGAQPDLDLRILPLRLEGTFGEYETSRNYLYFPPLSEGSPEPGKRVSFSTTDSGPYAVLYLPPCWEQGKKYPVVVEYPGNIFFHAKCYSTGRPEQCVMGYGMTKGEGSILLSLPFVDRRIPDVVENGFGNPEETVAYAKSIIETVIEQFGGDRENLVLTGFSRGSIACGFIGLRDAEIAAYWKGIHGCQHYDGSKWRESDMAGAVERAKRFRGKAIFQTDNNQEKYAPVVEATDSRVEWTWVSSGLGFHATSMFLDDRPTTRQLREWYRNLVSSK